MKKLLALCTFIFTVLALQAQIKKGNKLVGASLGSANVAIGEGGAGLSLQVNPTAGIMVTDHWMAGAGVTLGTIVSDGFTGIVGVNPFARYYFHSKNNNDSLYKGFFLQSGLGVITVFGNVEQSSLNAGLGGGYCRFITPNVGLELTGTAGFSKILDDYDGNINIGFSFGLQIVLDKNVRLFRRKK